MLEYIWLCRLLDQIEQLTSKAWKIISELEAFHFAFTGEDVVTTGDKAFQEELLKESILEIHLKILFALESLQLRILLENYKSGFKKYQQSLDDIDLHWYGDYFYSPALEYQSNFINTINCYCEKKNLGLDRNILERILRGTPKIIFDSNLKPHNETEIKKTIRQHLIHPFPDTVPETSISKVTKCYKPDFGVKSLKSAIEYKFADSELEAKKVIGGIYEDMVGYEGSNDWDHFYAVVYMTSPFFTEDQILSEFEMSKVNNKWVLILVHGTGARKKTISKARPRTAKKKTRKH